MVLSAARYFTDAFTPSDDQERSFFAALRLPNGVYKTTERDRMGDVDAASIHALRRFGGQARKVLDVGVSSGVSSVEWRQALRAAGYQADLLGVDISLCARLDRYSAVHGALVDRDGRPLQHILFGLGIRPYVARRRDYLTGEAWLSALGGWLFDRASRRPARSRDVLLLSTLARGEASAFQEADVFAHEPRFDGAFDMVRAANILNRAYFPAERIAAALSNLKRYCTGPGALLIVARTTLEGRNDGAIFRLGEDGRFQAAETLGAGSEVAELVLAA